MKQKVLLLFCGGTISMRARETGELDTTHDDDHKAMLRFAPRIEDLANIDVRFVINEDSSNMDKTAWEKVTTIIKEEYDNYDGFVITTGTDTMAYLSSALSFSIQNIGKPIAITGAQIPLEEIRTDARINLINVVMLACSNLAGIFIVFGDKIVLGSRAEKFSDIELNAFGTCNKPDLGLTTKVFSSFDIDNPEKYIKNNENKPIFKNGFNDNIACIYNTPGLNNKYIKGLIKGGIEAIIFRSFGTGNIPEVLFPSLELAKSKKIPVIVTTQCKEGTTVLAKYSLGRKALELGVIEAFDMSIEAASTKCMWMLAQGVSYDRFKEIFQADIAGEVDNTIATYILKDKNKATDDLLNSLVRMKNKKVYDL